jgi:hypothetical protein
MNDPAKATAMALFVMSLAIAATTAAPSTGEEAILVFPGGQINLPPAGAAGYIPSASSLASTLSKSNKQIGSSKLSPALVGALSEQRNIAAVVLANDLLIARNTSAGSVAFSNSEKEIGWLRQMLASPPQHDIVVTRITVKSDQACALHYVSFEDYQKASEQSPLQWQSYNINISLPVRAYIFRVTRIIDSKTAFERITVWDEPTVREIMPLFSQ